MESSANIKTQEQFENAPKLYRFDKTDFDITFNAHPMAKRPAFVTHKLRRPTLDELKQWQKAATYETVQVSKRENEIIIDGDDASIALWNKLILSVKGYDFKDGQPAGEFRPLSDEQKEKMSASHKIAAIRGLYLSHCEIEYEGDDEAETAAPVVFGGEIWRIKQDIRDGEFILTHILQEPTEAQRRKFNQGSSTTTMTPGARKTKSKIRTNLAAYIALYDELVIGIEGGTVNGLLMSNPQWADKRPFLAAIDPIIKQDVVHALTGELDGQLRD